MKDHWERTGKHTQLTLETLNIMISHAFRDRCLYKLTSGLVQF
ncbi:hypothetical protein [Paenibacillus sp. UMB4589-SE434]|nr:hypothetical protein [Paenibacillus sp. UMB4589-SE434]MDK8179936.1 hypothetical protein [Paenibacillus sp. UMB4589-SE434]